MAHTVHSPPSPVDFQEIQALQPLPLLAARLRWLSRAAALTVVVVGVAVLLGWLLDVGVLKHILPDLAAMKPNTALSFVLLGLALLGLQAGAPLLLQRTVRPMAAVVVLMALLTLGEHRLGWDLGIDQWLFRDTATAVYPGRMPPFTAVNFLLLGTALLLFKWQTYRAIVGGFVVFTLLNALFALVGFFYDAEAVYAVSQFAAVALHTAATFVVLSAGILLNWPDSRLMALLTSQGTGGVMARRLLPMALLIPLAIGWLETQGVRATLYTKSFGDMIFVVAAITFFAVVILRNASTLQRLDRARSEAVTALQGAYDALTLRVQEGSEALQALKGLQAASIELSRADSYDEVCRRAVELGRSRLGLDRLSLWFTSDDPKFMVGSFGTDEHGQIRDERGKQFSVEVPLDDRMQFGLTSTFYQEEAPLHNDHSEVVGRGWVASAPLMDGERVIGRMYADNLLRGQPLPEYARELFSLYGATVGHLCMKKRTEEELRLANEQLEQRVQERTAALQASESQYRQIVELAEEGVWTIDIEEKTTFVNRRMAAMLGYEPEEMLGKTLFNFMDVEDRLTDSAGGRQIWDTLWETDFHFKRKDGGDVWALMATSPMISDAGDYAGAMMLVTDISERKTVESALRESEQSFRSLFEHSPISLWEQDFSAVKRYIDDLRAQGIDDFRAYCDQYPEEVGKCLAKIRVVDVNSASLAVYKAANKAELLGNISRYAGQESYAQNQESLIAIAEGKTHFATELPNNAVNGERIEIALSWSVMPGYEQTYEKVVVSIKDITERKQAQAQAEAERRLLQTVIDNQLDYVFVKDMEGRFILNNAAHLRSLDKTAAEVLGRGSRDLYPPELAAVFEADDEDVLHTGKVIINQEQQTLGAGGAIRWVLTTKVPLWDAEGRITGLVGISRDISERKQVEAQLDAERRLLRAVIDNLPDYIFVKDTEGRFTLSNVAHAASVGKAADELVGLHARDVFPKDLAAKFEADDNHVMHSGEAVINQERRTVGSDGLPRWVLTTKVPLRDVEGNIAGLVGISHDITQRRNAQEALRESEARFRAMNEASPLGIFLTDEDGKCVYVNALHQQITGQSFAESLDLGWSEVVYSEDREVVLNRWFESVRDKTLYQSEHRLLKSDGTMAWVSEKAAAIYDGETLLGYVGTVEDISERKAAEEAVRKQEALYRLLAQNLPNSAVLLFDHDLRYLVAEGPALAPFGFSKENMEGRTLGEVAPDYAEALGVQYRKALAGETFSFDWQAGDYDYLVQGLPVKNPDGTIFAGMLLIQDITERKAAEESRSRLAAIVESSFDPILSTTMEGTITSWNMGAQHLYGYSAEEMIGQPVSRIVPRELPQEVPDIISRIQQGERIDAYETVRVRKDGEWVAVAVSISPLRDDEGRITGISSIHRDINERKLAEQQRLELELERGKVDMLARFVGDASHDLKTPLTIIKSSLYLLEKQPDPVKRQRHVGNVNKEAQRMETLLDEMLSMSWLDVTAGARDAQPQDLNALVGRVVEQRALLAESKSQQFDFHPQADLPPVLAYGAELEKALAQIIDNALHYTPDGGQVSVETALGDNRVKIIVKDTGIGIAPEDIDHIFERFWRADKARGTKAGGTGLGLAIAKKIVEDHGGRIEVESRVDEGSIFTIFMPVVVE